MEKVRRMVGLMMIFLVLTMPFISASSIQIVQNSGQENIDTFVDAADDVWTLRAIVNAQEAVTVDTVSLKVGDHQQPFDSCTSTALGNECQLTSTVSQVRESSIPFTILYSGTDPATERPGQVHIDGSAPLISDFSVSQQGNQLTPKFKVTDKVASDKPAVGIKSITIEDLQSAAVLKTIEFELGKEAFDYVEDDGENITFSSINEQGRRGIKVTAIDWLGHSSSKSTFFTLDTTAPIIEDSLKFKHFGEFIGSSDARSDLTVDVRDKDISSVQGFSAQAEEFDGIDASCERDLADRNLNHCRWSSVLFHPDSSIAVRVVAIDRQGNKAERTFTKNFQKDDSAPVVDYFGTGREFDGKSYLKQRDNTLILRYKEQGAGISQEGIRADMSWFGKESYTAPSICNETESTCLWKGVDVGSGQKNIRAHLSRFQDKVGNAGSSSEVEFIVDEEAPQVSKVSISAVGEVGEKDYVSSNDQLKIKLDIVEDAGLQIALNLNDVVMDAKTKFPEDVRLDLGPGWQLFTEDACLKESGVWHCILETEPIKSGPDSAVNLEIKVFDTAGNEAVGTAGWKAEKPDTMKSGSAGKYSFELLGLDVEDTPDVWEFSSAKALIPFIDVATSNLIDPRMAFAVDLKSATANAKALKVELEGCQSDKNTITIGRQLLWNNKYAQGQTSPLHFNLILELQHFDSKSVLGSEKFMKIEETCRVRIYSQIGKNALSAAEVQEFKVQIPLGYSELGSREIGLEEKIKYMEDSVRTGFWGAIGEVNKYLRLAQFAAGIAQTAISAANLVWSGIVLYDNSGVVAQKVLDIVSFGFVTAPAAQGSKEAIDISRNIACNGGVEFTGAVGNIVHVVQLPISLLNCEVNTCSLSSFVGSPEKQQVGQAVCSVLNGYNAQQDKAYQTYQAVGEFRGQSVAGAASQDTITSLSKFGQKTGGIFGTKSIKENIVLSTGFLCIPGVLENLNKLRNIQCRHIQCLKQDVPQGVATVGSCEEMAGLLTCKYVVGQLFAFMPLKDFMDGMIRDVQDLIRSPISLIPLAFTVGCSTFCNTDWTLGLPKAVPTYTCVTANFIMRAFSIVDGAIGSYNQFTNDISKGGTDYCAQVLDNYNGEGGLQSYMPTLPSGIPNPFK